MNVFEKNVIVSRAMVIESSAEELEELMLWAKNTLQSNPSFLPLKCTLLIGKSTESPQVTVEITK